jgi:pyridoxamine 5'-phosphate oxidase family protein
MSTFTPAEIEYLNSQRLGRLATQGASGDLHVVPARFRYNADTDTIDVFGGGMGTSKKYRDVARTGRAAFVVDDVPERGKQRGVEIRGTAQAMPEGGDIMRGDDPQFIRLTPTYVASWGIDTDPFNPVGRAAK